MAFQSPVTVDNPKYMTQEDTKIRGIGTIVNLAALTAALGSMGRLGTEAVKMMSPPARLPVEPDDIPEDKACFLPGDPKKRRIPVKIAADDSVDAIWGKSPAAKNMSSVASAVAKPIYKMFHSTQAESPDPSYQTGDQLAWPGTMAIGLPAAALTGYAGWRGTDALLNWNKERGKKSDLEEAKQHYDQLVQELLKGHSKTAQDLDALAEDMVNRKQLAGKTCYLPELKEAGWKDHIPGWNWAKDTGNELLGGYGAYALLSALVSGAVAHNYFSGRSTDATTREATKRRMMARLKPSPTTLAVCPNDEDSEGLNNSALGGATQI